MYVTKVSLQSRFSYIPNTGRNQSYFLRSEKLIDTLEDWRKHQRLKMRSVVTRLMPLMAAFVLLIGIYNCFSSSIRDRIIWPKIKLPIRRQTKERNSPLPETTVVFTTPHDDSSTWSPSKEYHYDTIAQNQTEPLESVVCGTTQEKRHVVFIKVHKAGSSTLANIFFRFGFSRNLTFMLPAEGVHVSMFLGQPWNVKPPPKGVNHYDILTNHAVYNEKEIQRLFPNDAVVVAVLRKPMGQLESAIYYYYGRHFDGYDKVGIYLRGEKPLSLDRYVNNSMAYELGVPRDQFKNESYVRSHVEELSRKIDFVLILEKLDESLVILKRRLCWKLTDILYIIRNVNRHKPHINRTEEELQLHRQMMPADYIIYEFFYERLEQEISKMPDLSDEVSYFKSILNRVSIFCTNRQPDLETLKIEKSKWNELFYIPRTECRFMQLDGLQILAYAKKYQYGQS